MDSQCFLKVPWRDLGIDGVMGICMRGEEEGGPENVSGAKARKQALRVLNNWRLREGEGPKARDGDAAAGEAGRAPRVWCHPSQEESLFQESDR